MRKLTHQQKKNVFISLKKFETVYEISENTGISTATIYKWRAKFRKNPEKYESMFSQTEIVSPVQCIDLDNDYVFVVPRGLPYSKIIDFIMNKFSN